MGRLSDRHVGCMSIGLERTLVAASKDAHMPGRGVAAKARLLLWGSSRQRWDKMKAQTRGVQQGTGIKYIPQPETKYKEVSDKLEEFQMKIKKLFVNSQKAYCVILKCTPPSRQHYKMDSWLNPPRKKNKLLVYLTDGDTGYEIGLCFSLQILFLT